jgi:hypothetical protein
LNEMNGEITSLSKKLHSVKSKVDEKGNMMTDTSPLIRIKTTLRGIKAEIRDYDLQIGILEHNLVQRRLAKVNTWILNENLYYKKYKRFIRSISNSKKFWLQELVYDPFIALGDIWHLAFRVSWS